MILVLSMSFNFVKKSSQKSKALAAGGESVGGCSHGPRKDERLLLDEPSSPLRSFLRSVIDPLSHFEFFTQLTRAKTHRSVFRRGKQSTAFWNYSTTSIHHGTKFTMAQDPKQKKSRQCVIWSLHKKNLILGLFFGSAVLLFLQKGNGKLPRVDHSEGLSKSSHECAETEQSIESNQTTDIANNIWKGSNCARWIAEEQRIVLFVELNTWKHYYGKSKYKTGEYYVSATWVRFWLVCLHSLNYKFQCSHFLEKDYALRRNGFGVHRVSTKQYYDRMKKNEIRKYHLIFVRDPKWHRYYDEHDILCKVRPMYYFGGWYRGKNPQNYRFQFPFAENQILTAHPGTRNTFLGYFPHNLLNEVNLSNASRGRVGLLYGKKAEYFDGREHLIQKLLDEGFELHTTCSNSMHKNCSFPNNVIRHGHLNPQDFSKLMGSFSFMLGFQRPLVSLSLHFVSRLIS